jgi:hypothetical protein
MGTTKNRQQGTFKEINMFQNRLKDKIMEKKILLFVFQLQLIMKFSGLSKSRRV